MINNQILQWIYVRYIAWNRIITNRYAILLENKDNCSFKGHKEEDIDKLYNKFVLFY